MSAHPEFDCVDCATSTIRPSKGGNGEYYMVDDDVWQCAMHRPVNGAKVIDNKRGMLCIGCLEGRLGRELQCDDFKCVPLNAMNSIDPETSPRLLDRMIRGIVVQRRRRTR